MITVKPTFTVKTFDCMHQTGPTGQKLERLGISPTFFMITMSVMGLGHCVKMGVTGERDGEWLWHLLGPYANLT